MHKESIPIRAEQLGRFATGQQIVDYQHLYTCRTECNRQLDEALCTRRNKRSSGSMIPSSGRLDATLRSKPPALHVSRNGRMKPLLLESQQVSKGPSSVEDVWSDKPDFFQSLKPTSMNGCGRRGWHTTSTSNLDALDVQIRAILSKQLPRSNSARNYGIGRDWQPVPWPSFLVSG